MTNIELKNALNILRAEVTALRDRVGALEAKSEQRVVVTVTPTALEQVKKFADNRGLCPKCKNKPNHFFHVRTCKG